ncbi:MAG: hypothetical protein PHF84_10570 [bacterium]|nr:hypothetical protein [bacterium]
MTRKTLCILMLLMFVIAFTGCTTNRHVIGSGPKSNEEVTGRQWYILFGLVPLNEVNSKEMAGNASDYEIQTQQSVVDVILSMFTSIVTIQSRTVTVTK